MQRIDAFGQAASFGSPNSASGWQSKRAGVHGNTLLLRAFFELIYDFFLQITVLRIKEADKEPQKRLQEGHPGSYSSPSEVTVTISYSVSSDDKLIQPDSKRSISELHETEVKTIDLEDYLELPQVPEVE